MSRSEIPSAPPAAFPAAFPTAPAAGASATARWPGRAVTGRAESRRGPTAARLPVRGCGHDATHDPSAAGDAGTLVAEVLELHAALAGSPSLEPGPQINTLFGRLVELAVAARPAAVVETVLADPVLATRLPDLRARCARGEYALERAWARRVLAADDPGAALEDFPYLQNYRDLTRLEFHAVAGQGTPPRRALFIGSGPLPLSALLLARHGVAVDAIDVDTEAVALGGALAEALGDPVRVGVGDVMECGDLRDYDLVCVAALVGMDPAAKSAALARVRAGMRPGAIVLARSAHSLRALLYPVLETGDLGGLEPLAVLHPHTDVVNSVVLARVPGTTG